MTITTRRYTKVVIKLYKPLRTCNEKKMRGRFKLIIQTAFILDTSFTRNVTNKRLTSICCANVFDKKVIELQESVIVICRYKNILISTVYSFISTNF